MHQSKSNWGWIPSERYLLNISRTFLNWEAMSSATPGLTAGTRRSSSQIRSCFSVSLTAAGRRKPRNDSCRPKAFSQRAVSSVKSNQTKSNNKINTEHYSHFPPIPILRMPSICGTNNHMTIIFTVDLNLGRGNASDARRKKSIIRRILCRGFNLFINSSTSLEDPVRSEDI